MSWTQRQKSTPATGIIDRKGHRKIAISLPEVTFLKIRNRAAKAGVPFTTMATKLIECGLLDYEESEMHEEKVHDLA